MARTRIHGAGLAHCEFRRGDMYSLPVEDGAFDLVTLDRVLTLASGLPLRCWKRPVRCAQGGVCCWSRISSSSNRAPRPIR